MQTNESNRDNVPDRQRGTETTNDSDPEHSVPVAKQLTDRQRELVGFEGADE